MPSASIRSTPQKGTITRRPRDPRLDLFRGLAMFIIFIAHMPGNSWTNWIPARFGFSDATETFVFCSGMASSFAFAAVFHSHGWFMGTARIAHRIWQVYWAQIGVFFIIAVGLAFLDNVLDDGGTRFTGQLNLVPFFKHPMDQLVGLMTLTYVPNFFDILPMYLVILALVPIVMALYRVSLWAVFGFVVATWLAAGFGYLDLPAEPWSNRTWFFNPFGWQLVFFTGFAFGRGWIKAPPVTKPLIWLAITIVVITIPLAYFRILREVEEFRIISGVLRPFTGKTDFGILRYVHFLATAYLAWVAFGIYQHKLMQGRAGKIVAIIRKVGQQSLAVFLTSLVLAWFFGVAVKLIGRSELTIALANILGFAILIGTAYGVAWFKSQPWRKAPVQKAPAVNSDPVSSLQGSPHSDHSGAFAPMPGQRV
ncbi:MAG: OpgC domain-containing protein [Cohaesibacteraceae bacterium]|nr:OpgC domain-containing protein [Cohaesibacteraceae bacterium]